MKYLTILLLMLIAYSCASKKETNRALISGVLNNVKDSISYIKCTFKTMDGKLFSDTAKVENGKYSMTVEVATPKIFWFVAYQKNWQDVKNSFREIFLEPGEISIISNDRFENVTVTGSKSNDEFEKFKKLEEPYTRLDDSAYNYYSTYYKSLSPEQQLPFSA